MPKANAHVSVVLVLLSVREGELVGLTREDGQRDNVHISVRAPATPDTSLQATATRLLTTALGTSSAAVHLEQLGVGEGLKPASVPALEVKYLALTPQGATAPSGGSSWQPVRKLVTRATPLSPRDQELLEEATEAARSTLERLAVATAFCPPEFTVGDLRRVYEAIWDTTLDPGNFHRKVTRIPGFLEPTGRTAMRSCGRPGQTYRAGSTPKLNPPLMRTAIG